jgi:glycosyltransferase involved in cell wall biosynthesis
MDNNIINKGLKTSRLLSVCIMTYNHKKFIQEAIESVLNQETEYSYELVIGEDFSTDGTREIVKNYVARYPGIIRMSESHGNLGMVKNFLNILKQCNGKYIALLEGDDKWLNNNKITTQLDFLEAHPDFSLSCHNAWVVFEEKEILASKFNARLSRIGLEDIISDWIIPTASIIFRKDAFTIPDWFERIRNWDYALQIIVSLHGRVHYLREPMCLYRKHNGGNSFNNDYSVYQTIPRLIELFDLLTPLMGEKYLPLIAKRKKALYRKLKQSVWIDKHKVLYKISPFYICRNLIIKSKIILHSRKLKSFYQ